MITTAALPDSRCAPGEDIVWDNAQRVFWWTDVQELLLQRHDPVTGQGHQRSLPQRTSPFVLTDEPDVLILGLAKDIVRFDTHTGVFMPLAGVESDSPVMHVNDGCADRSRNYVFGTMHEGGSEPIGSSHRFMLVGTLQHVVLPYIVIVNSIILSPDGTTLYWCDTRSRRIHAYDYDGQTGQVTNICVLVGLCDQDADDAHEGSPDDLAVDADDRLWNTERGGNRLTRYTPDGHVLVRISVSALQPTCSAFGGKVLDTLYLTTACDGLPLHHLTEDVNAGATL